MSLKDKIIALDIDGTIAKDNCLPTDDTCNQIASLIEQGYNIILVTGRGYASMKIIYEKCKLNTFCVLFNGALVYNPFNDKVIRDVLFPKNYVFDILKDKEIMDCVEEIMLEQDDIVYSLSGHKWYDNQVNGPFKDNLKDNIHCVNILVKEPSMHKIIEKKINDDNYRYRYWFKQGEVYSLNYTKKDGVEVLLKYLNKTNKDLIFIGDSDNDIEILKYAGLGVAMKNATDNAKNAADEITSEDVNNQGAIKHILKMIEMEK